MPGNWSWSRSWSWTVPSTQCPCSYVALVSFLLLCVWISPTWTALLSGTKLSFHWILWPFQRRKWSGRLVPLFRRYNRVPVFGFTCHHVCWGSVHPRILKMVCNPCSVWYVKGSLAETPLMSIGLQISFRLNLISARRFSFWCDGWDYRCSRRRLSPASASDPSPHFYFPAHYPPRMNSAADVCLFIDTKAVLWLDKPLPGFSTLRWREGKGFTEAAVEQRDPVLLFIYFPKKKWFFSLDSFMSADSLKHYYLLLHGGTAIVLVRDWRMMLTFVSDEVAIVPV